MSNRIDLQLSPSIIAGLLGTAPWLLLLAFIAIAGATGSRWLWTLAPAAMLGGIYQYRHIGLLRTPSSVVLLRLEEGRLHSGLANGQQIEVQPSGSSRIGPCLTLLKLQPVDTRFSAYSCLLVAGSHWWPGNVTEDEFRKLRVWLRLGRPRHIQATESKTRRIP
ncbi:hypothetical protein FWJ25_15375 [Marinobacter salinexigens]|uniref:Toxin CptA n=1 Tax=Marinobacter salinexigens TaxID=2919747 RepID=A0A5B0VBI0_9GAMM|nr:hypothetical protein [Marinobacter salinexigens]KAA1172010.1 hypothetical protein FWJ25_15375 [Marinobacter salinexigens]